MDWQPIETAPKDGSAILLYYPEGQAPDERFVTGWWESFAPYEDKMGADGVWCMECGEPTHWLPIPPAPDTVRYYHCERDSEGYWRLAVIAAPTG